MWSHFYFPKMIELENHYGWRRQPDQQKEFTNEWGEKSVVVANRFGNRGVAYPRERTPGTYRVLVLGDSFAEGAQVNEPDVFTALVEAREKGVEMINAAVVAYGTVQEYLYLRDEGLAFNPDLVLVCFYRNDLADNILSYHMQMGPRPYAKLVNGNVEIIEQLTEDQFEQFCIPAPLTVFFYKHSFIYYALTDRVYREKYSDEMTARDRANIDLVSWPDRKRVFYDVVGRMNDLAKAHGAEPGLFLIPSQQEIAQRKAEHHEDILRWAAEQHIDCFSGLEPMVKATDEGKKPYFEIDIHWTKAGHQVAGAIVADYVHKKRAAHDAKTAKSSPPD